MEPKEITLANDNRQKQHSEQIRIHTTVLLDNLFQIYLFKQVFIQEMSCSAAIV